MLLALTLTDFRNYASASLTPAPGVTVLHGDNGQGKTNLIEAVYVLSAGGSARPGGSEALVRHGTEVAIVRGIAEREGHRRDVALEIPRRGRIRAAVNGDVVRRRSDALGHVRAVLFAPDDLALVKGGPSGRRDLLDATAALLRPAAADRLADYEKVVRQRAALLRSAKGAGRRPATMDTWDQRLLETGLAVVSDRLDVLGGLGPRAEEIHTGFTAGATKLAFEYRGATEADSFRDALQAAEREERERALCLVGPHRDDVLVTLDGQDARVAASQGESRTIALSLRLAVHAMATEAAGPPLLLLDDVLSELDPRRAESLLALLPSCQTIITTADRPERLPLPAGSLLVRVENARLS